MNNNIFITWFLMAGFCAGLGLTPIAAANPASGAANAVLELAFTGRIEPKNGMVEISSLVDGRMIKLHVREGDGVEKGQLLAEIDAPTLETAVQVADARLREVEAGHGAEEIAAAAAEIATIEAQLELARRDFQRAEMLLTAEVMSDETYIARRQTVASLEGKLEKAKQMHLALVRGALPEEVARAEAELEAARVKRDQRLIRAPFSGVVARIHRYPGAVVSTRFATPILTMADLSKLRIRIEVPEEEIFRLKNGLPGRFEPFQRNGPQGTLRLSHFAPAFGPRRLFEPNTVARHDVRVIDAFCEIEELPEGYFPGQRVMVIFPVSESP